MSSTELLDAASISITSSELALAIETHESQTPHGLDRRSLLAVQAGREDLRGAGLAGAARPDEQVGVVDLAAGDGVRQRPHDLLLADDVGERAGAMAAIERRAGRHGTSSLDGRAVAVGRSARPPAGAEFSGPCTLHRCGTRGAATVWRLRSGTPTTPEGGRLRLLPSGPDLVHGSSSSWDLTIDAANGARTSGLCSSKREFSPAGADCGLQGTASAPPSTVC